MPTPPGTTSTTSPSPAPWPPSAPRTASPSPNLLGDFGGGSLYLALGIVCAILEARTSGQGQVVDAAITDGTAHLMTMFYGLHAAGLHGPARGTNLLDGGAPHYDVYECADGKYVSVAPIEAKFRAILLQRLALDPALEGPPLRQALETLFRTRPREAWCELLEGTDACFAPVLSMDEAATHPHNAARATFIDIAGITQPAPAPRFSRTVPIPPTPPEAPGAEGRQALVDWGLGATEITQLAGTGAILLPV